MNFNLFLAFKLYIRMALQRAASAIFIHTLAWCNVYETSSTQIKNVHMSDDECGNQMECRCVHRSSCISICRTIFCRRSFRALFVSFYISDAVPNFRLSGDKCLSHSLSRLRITPFVEQSHFFFYQIQYLPIRRRTIFLFINFVKFSQSSGTVWLLSFRLIGLQFHVEAKNYLVGCYRAARHIYAEVRYGYHS